MDFYNEEFPAPAGINRGGSDEAFPINGVPRASGDKPRTQNSKLIYELSSPRQRG